MCVVRFELCDLFDVGCSNFPTTILKLKPQGYISTYFRRSSHRINWHPFVVLRRFSTWTVLFVSSWHKFLKLCDFIWLPVHWSPVSNSPKILFSAALKASLSFIIILSSKRTSQLLVLCVNLLWFILHQISFRTVTYVMPSTGFIRIASEQNLLFVGDFLFLWSNVDPGFTILLLWVHTVDASNLLKLFIYLRIVLACFAIHPLIPFFIRLTSLPLCFNRDSPYF